MPRFRCSACDCVEDTALSNFWSSRLRQAPALCSACDPKIAKWHGEFPREPATGWRTDERGILVWNKREVDEWLGRSAGTAAEPSGGAAGPAQPRTPEVSEA